MEDILSTVLDLSSKRNLWPENGSIVVRSFFAFVEMQLSLVGNLVYQNYPSLALYFDDLIPIQLPTADSQVAIWTRMYNTKNAFTLSEALASHDGVRGWSIPTGVCYFAVEYLLNNPEMCSPSLEWFPAIRLWNVTVPFAVETFQISYVSCTRDFAVHHLANWLNGSKEVEVVLIKRKEIVRQLEWNLPIGNNKRQKIHLFVL